MASTSSEEHPPAAPKKEQPQPGETPYPPPPQTPHDPQSTYPPPPPMMYHPHPMGYPPGQLPYGYPPPPPYRYPPYAQPPPGMYYPSPYDEPYSSGGPSCFRSVVLVVLIICLAYFMLAFITASNGFNYDDPFYTIHSFSVSNFSTSNSVLSCIWDAKINVSNPSYDARVSFSNFQVHVHYNSDELIHSHGESFELEHHQMAQLEMRTESNSEVIPPVPNSTVDTLAKDRDSGRITFTLKISAEATRTYDSSFLVWTLKEYIVAECRDLKVQFNNGTGDGSFNDDGKPVKCRVRLQ